MCLPGCLIAKALLSIYLLCCLPTIGLPGGLVEAFSKGRSFAFTKTEPDNSRGWIFTDRWDVVPAFEELMREREKKHSFAQCDEGSEVPGTKGDSRDALLQGQRRLQNRKCEE